MNIIETLNWRYATKRMTSQKVSQEDLETILEAIRLSPSAYGLQPYKIIVTDKKELINTIFEKACPQPVVKQCSHLIIFKTLKKITSEYVENYLKNMQKMRNASDEYIDTYRNKISFALLDSSNNNFNWAIHQTYLALGVALFAAAQLRIDATPMEGFSPDALNKILNLDTDKESTILLLALGYRDEKEDHLSKYPKVRKLKEEIIEKLMG